MMLALLGCRPGDERPDPSESEPSETGTPPIADSAETGETAHTGDTGGTTSLPGPCGVLVTVQSLDLGPQASDRVVGRPAR